MNSTGVAGDAGRHRRRTPRSAPCRPCRRRRGRERRRACRRSSTSTSSAAPRCWPPRPRTPMTMLAAIETKPAAGVIATRPTTAPMQAPIADGFRPRIQSMNDPRHHRRRRRGVGRGEGQHGGRFAASAEPALKPNQPNHSMPVPRMMNGMWAGTCASPAQVALPPAQHVGAGQRGQPRRHVHHGAAGEVEHAPLAQEPVRMPGPVRQRRVDEEREQRHEHQVGAEAHPLGKGARDQRRRDDRELQLEQREQQQRDRRRQPRIRRVSDAVGT